MAERVCCLYRVSTEKQLDTTELKQPDIPMQRKACRQFAEKMGWTIVREEQENGVSGFKLSVEQRDKIQLIKSCAQEGSFDILLVFMFDRIGRRAEETPFVVEWLVEHGIRVWSVTEGEQRFDSHTDYLLNYIRYWQASGESKKTSIRTKTALAQMVLEGRFRGGHTPYGYQLVKSGVMNKHKREINKLIPDEKEASVVRLMFDLCVHYGYGRSRIATELRRRGIKNRQGEDWSEATVGAMLHNVLYVGVLRSGNSYSMPFEELQIIDQATFDMAKRLMNERATQQKETRIMPLNTKGQSLLSGNIFCGHCNGRLVLTTNTKTTHHIDGSFVRKSRIRYICYQKTRHRRPCDGQTGYAMHKIDALVKEEMLQVFEDVTQVDHWSVIIQCSESRAEQLQREYASAKTTEAAKSRTYAKLKEQAEEHSYDGVEKNFAYEFVKDKFRDMMQAQEYCTDVKSRLQAEQARLEKLKSFHEEIIIWHKIFDICEKERQKMIASHAIKRVEVFRGYQIRITYQEELQTMLDMIEGTMR